MVKVLLQGGVTLDVSPYELGRTVGAMDDDDADRFFEGYCEETNTSLWFTFKSGNGDKWSSVMERDDDDNNPHQ